MKTDIYNTQGKKAGSVDLPENVFGVNWNDALMYQVVRTMQGNARTNVAHTKDRGEVRGGGRKPWQQKGTGRARHGSSRSPIWRGGGITHGPRNSKVFGGEIPKKMRAKALFMALSRKFRDGEILFVDSFGISAPKTAEAKKALTALSGVKGFEKLSGGKSHNLALIATPGKQENLAKSFRNIGSIGYDAVENLNPVSVLRYKYIVLENPMAAVATIAKRLTRGRATAEGAAKKAKSE